MWRVAINSLIFHSGGCTSGRDSRDRHAQGTEGEKTVATSKIAREEREKEGDEDRVKEREKERE